MKIAVTSTGPTLDSQVDPRFGRAAYILIVDSETMEFEAVQNPMIAAAGGAGIATAQLVADRGAQVVLTGNVGPNAFQALSAAGIQVVTGVIGMTARQAVQAYLQGQLQPTPGPTVPSHFGMGFPPIPGMGWGGGWRHRYGWRGGRGGWRHGYGWRGGGIGPGGIGPMQPIGGDPQAELQMLRQYAEQLKRRLEEINRRIEELEKKGR